MNAGVIDPVHPVEHVYYDNVVAGKTYKILVNLYSFRGNKESSSFTVRIFTERQKVVANWSGIVSR